jgi:hypothetical protein
MSKPQETDYSVPYKQGALYGAAAFVASYAVVFALYTYELGQKTADFSDAFYGKSEVAGWLLYGANNVPVETTLKYEGGGPAETFSGNVLEGVYGAFQAGNWTDVTQLQQSMLNYFFGDGGAAVESIGLVTQADNYGGLSGSMVVPKLVYYAVPVLLLAAAGYLLTRKVAESRQLTDDQRVLTGASIALGYVGLAIAAAMTVFSVSTDQVEIYTIEPSLGGTAVAMLVLYPVVAGAVGGYLAD